MLETARRSPTMARSGPNGAEDPSFGHRAQAAAHGASSRMGANPFSKNDDSCRQYPNDIWVFFQILRTWVESNHMGNASTEDFLAHCDEVSGRDLEELFQGVLFDALIPVVPEYEEALRDG